ncbi:hypothetical protein [Lentibacillus halodurans]|nr:hypothetical protein [Lentibacillus halodurans]
MNFDLGDRVFESRFNLAIAAGELFEVVLKVIVSLYFLASTIEME